MGYREDAGGGDNNIEQLIAQLKSLLPPEIIQRLAVDAQRSGDSQQWLQGVSDKAGFSGEASLLEAGNPTGKGVSQGLGAIERQFAKAAPGKFGLDDLGKMGGKSIESKFAGAKSKVAGNDLTQLGKPGVMDDAVNQMLPPEPGLDAGLMQKIDNFAGKLPTGASPVTKGSGAALLGGLGASQFLKAQSGDRGAPPHPGMAEIGGGGGLPGGGGASGSFDPAVMPASDGMPQMPNEVPPEALDEGGGDPRNYVRYTVQEGDNLIRIAKRVYGDGSKYGLLAKINGITDPNMILTGHQLLIPPGRGEV